MLFKSNLSINSSVDNQFQQEEIARCSIEYTDCSERFYNVSRDFSKQYAHIYSARLNTFRNILSPIVKKKWSGKYKILKLCELREKSTLCVIIGTIFKHQQLKPSILKELSDQLEIIPQPMRYEVFVCYIGYNIIITNKESMSYDNLFPELILSTSLIVLF